MRATCRRAGPGGLGAGLLSVAALAGATPPAETGRDAATAWRAGERLSDWLLRQVEPGTAPGTPYPAGLMWTHPAEAATQARLKGLALQALTEPRLGALNPLAAWVESLPVTGRVFLAGTDARWLQANPDQDPRLSAGDALVMPRRPATVTVLLPDARWCQVRHQADATAAEYLTACADASGAGPADEGWVVQPDGRVRVVGLQAWNAQAQDRPAPGAWIWAPPRQGPVAREASGLLTRFLGTQGLAPDLAPSAARLVGPLSLPAVTAASRRPARDLGLTASDWGEIGLLQPPSARMGSAGGARLHWSGVWPYTRGTVMLQPLDWLEAGFRYTDIANRAYGAGTPQSYKDKSIDFKLRLWQESAWVPQLSVGVRDIGGTGLFSGEYLVASKRWGDFDASLGLGWGYLGARGDLRNPLSWIDPDFKRRAAGGSAFGGTVNWNSMFRGPTALFGGVQWHSPWPNLWLKAELDGNDYRNEPSANPQPQSTPLNLGLVWRPVPWADLSAGVERGKRLMLGLTLDFPLAQMSTPKVSDPPAPRLAPPQSRGGRTDWSPLVEAVRAQTEWEVDAVRESGAALHLHLSLADGPHVRERVDRVAALMHQMAPPGVRRFVLHFDPAGLADMATLEVEREAWVRGKTEALPPSAGITAVRSPAPSAPGAARGDAWSPDGRGLKYALSPYYNQVLGGPDGFLLFELGAAARARLALTDSTELAGALQLRLLDNFNKFRTTENSGLPPVRTFSREYVTTSRLTLPKLHLQHAGRLGRDQFYLAYAGLLEPMFGGVGAEWMWRPAGSPLSLAFDVNRVRQRAFAQDLRFRDYEVTTGHATLRWHTGWQGVVVAGSAGRYLAGDRGATLDVSRVFDNGVAMGAYATKTNVPAAVFGEGSYDKGIYVRVPFDVILTRSTTGTANIMWRPLTRDGGAKLERPSLEEITRLRGPDVLRYAPAGNGPRARTGESVFGAPMVR